MPAQNPQMFSEHHPSYAPTQAMQHLRKAVMGLPGEHVSHDPSADVGDGHTTTACAPLKIVVVDDDAFLLHLYDMAIRQWPLKTELVCFSDGRQALAHLGRESPHLLIVDWEMPALSGSTLLSSLYQLFDMERTTTVVVSSVEERIIRADQALPPGVSVFGKPVPFDRLFDIASKLTMHGCQK